jgi:hypothetical protein
MGSEWFEDVGKVGREEVSSSTGGKGQKDGGDKNRVDMSSSDHH